MYCVQSRIYCNDCTKSHIDGNYTTYLRSQGHFNNVRKNQCTQLKTNSMIVKTHFIKK